MFIQFIRTLNSAKTTRKLANPLFPDFIQFITNTKKGNTKIGEGGVGAPHILWQDIQTNTAEKLKNLSKIFQLNCS